MVSVASAVFIPIAVPLFAGRFAVSNPKRSIKLREETAMARKAEATVWMLAKIQGRPAVKRMVHKGRGWPPQLRGTKPRWGAVAVLPAAIALAEKL